MSKANIETIIAALREYAQRSELRGGNPYSARAYARAADALSILGEPLEPLIQQSRLQEIPSIGAATADLITRLYHTGTDKRLEEMRKEVPAGVLEMLKVPGLRPDKVLKLYKTLGINSLGALADAARSDRIKATKGLGASLQTKILNNMAIAESGEDRLHIHRASALLDRAKTRLAAIRPELTRLTAAGDLRRGCELVADLSLVAQVKDENSAEEKVRSSRLQLHLANKRDFGAALLHATGSSSHLEQLKTRASRQGMRLDQNGLWKGPKLIAGASETDIYAALGLQFVEPELREGNDEIAKAAKHSLTKLVTDDDIKGILHAHTDASDGVNPLEVMAAATRKRGYTYFGVADHSKSAHYAGGLSIDEIEAQHREIDRLNKQFGKNFKIFKGIESDILADGSLDYPDNVLSRFDFVVASVHNRFRLDRREQTQRILRAIANPYTTILGHMTGRQLLRRPGYDVDIEKLLKACARHDVAVEINANPWRLDLDWRWHRRALKLGCMMSINPDAHSTDEIDLTHWGVKMARKGGVPKGRVLNCMTLSSLERYLQTRKAKSARASAA